jgi:hypothetical protein
VQVRIAACGALREFAAHACPGYCATNVGYLAAGLVLHMDDCDGLVAEAACQVCIGRLISVTSYTDQ